MLFHSWQFAVFFAIVFLSYYALPQRFRWILLLGANYYFYMSWDPAFVVLILGITLLTYGCGRLLSAEGRSEKRRKAILAAGVALPVLALFFFKYFSFAFSQIALLLDALSLPSQASALKVILPVGISFYTFQAVGYVVDVYRGQAPAEKHIGYYALFVSFFPLLISGPIERAGNLLPQFYEEHRFRYENAADGLKRMAAGFFKKLVIADLISVKIEPVFAHVRGFNGFALLLSTVLFAIQIYCDFSGYSDIAIGAARMLGYRVRENFACPYFSRSIREFWRRWHISLSSWFSDYVYIPLGGSRVPTARHLLNLMITFAVSGLWHGANWTYLAWGALHGLYAVCGALFRKIPFPATLRARMDRPFPAALRTLFTFALVGVAWVFFRAESLADALYVLRYSVEGLGNPLRYIQKGVEMMNFRVDGLVKPLIGCLVLLFYDLIQYREDPIQRLNRRPAFVRLFVYTAFVCLTVMLSHKGIASEFIYFQF